MRIQITFKSKTHDVAVSGDSVEQIMAEYDKISKKLKLASPKLQSRHPLEHGGTTQKSAAGIREGILKLKAAGFFKSHRTLNQVQQELAKKGLPRPTTALSGPLKDLVRNDELKRDQTKGNGKKVWVYFA